MRLDPSLDQKDSMKTMLTGAKMLNSSPATANPLRFTSQ